jgi:hypothetical protein
VPPAKPVGGILDLVPGRELWLPIDLPPGHDFMICHVRDSATGKPRYTKGMFMDLVIR